MMMMMVMMMITMMVGVGRPQQLVSWLGSPARASRASRSRPFKKFPSRRCWRLCVILAFSSAFLPLRWSSACSRGVQQQKVEMILGSIWNRFGTVHLL